MDCIDDIGFDFRLRRRWDGGEAAVKVKVGTMARKQRGECREKDTVLSQPQQIAHILHIIL